MASRGAVAAAAAHLRAGRDPGAARPGRRRHLHRRRRHPDPGHDADGKATLTGVEAVIDKDLATELLAREIDADLFVMATDVDGVYADWGTPNQRRLERVTPDELRGMRASRPGRWARRSRPLPASSRRPGRRAAIGGLGEIEQIVDGTAGTQVVAG